MMLEVTRVYVDSGQPHWEVGVWDQKDNIRIEWYPDFNTADDRRNYLVRCYDNDCGRRVHKVLQTNRNEDAEYGAEWALYGDGIEFKTMRFTRKNPYILDGFKITHIEMMFAFGGAEYITYRRYPLIDAARIEAD